ncbi:DUF2309 domain-containing protein [Acidihalobacter prosperus]
MTLSPSLALKIRAMVYIAGEAIPNFWPMRSFIHHNPLHGLEHLPFEEAVRQGESLFHARGFLSREQYQHYLSSGRISQQALTQQIEVFSRQLDLPDSIDPIPLLKNLLTRTETQVVIRQELSTPTDVAKKITGGKISDSHQDGSINPLLIKLIKTSTVTTQPIYDSLDALFNTDIGVVLDELVVKSCLDFFDEGQSAWGMPGRKQGFFSAWRQLALHNLRFKLRGLNIERLLQRAEKPETMIALVMEELRIPENDWVDYFTHELTRLHGWAGFIRWRARAKHYYWQNIHPADLVDLLALRLSLSLALIQEHENHLPIHSINADTLKHFIENDTQRAFLQYELYTGNVVPAFAFEIEKTLGIGSSAKIQKLCARYTAYKREHEIRLLENRLQRLAKLSRLDLNNYSLSDVEQLIDTLRQFERDEGMLWLRAMEATALQGLAQSITIDNQQDSSKRPFAQALFCIDTRSEPIRRKLESIGDYQTYGIAGFFGVPMSFVELGKGSETYLCPALVSPRNLALEMSVDQLTQDHAITALEHSLHELKESVLAPFATVEAIGLLFGFDMFGKTLAPLVYHRWRQNLQPEKPATRLLLDKLSREQADSIVRAVQRALIVTGLKQELNLSDEILPDDVIRELREAALEHTPVSGSVKEHLKIDAESLNSLLTQLRQHYRVNRDEASRQMEQLARIGFSIREQTQFVAQALSSIGLTRVFSRFVLLVGHASISQNNPYESALDCGACGGNSGVNNARALAQMGNNPEVRARLRAQGIDIPQDTWFIPALHNTTTDQIALYDIDQLPPRHLLYIDRLRKGLVAASRLCAQERLPTLSPVPERLQQGHLIERAAKRNSLDWSQVRPEWGLSRNTFFIIGRRALTQGTSLESRAFLHSYDWRVDPKHRLLENILTGPLVVGQWINMEHYFSTVDNDHYGSGSKAYHNVAGRFGVMTGNLGDLRTGLPAQTVLNNGQPYHEPIRLISLIEAPFNHVEATLNGIAPVRSLVHNGWVRLVIVDPESGLVHVFDDASKQWSQYDSFSMPPSTLLENLAT